MTGFRVQRFGFSGFKVLAVQVERGTISGARIKEFRFSFFGKYFRDAKFVGR